MQGRVLRLTGDRLYGFDDRGQFIHHLANTLQPIIDVIEYAVRVPLLDDRNVPNLWHGLRRHCVMPILRSIMGTDHYSVNTVVLRA